MHAVRTNVFRVSSSTYDKTILPILLQRYWWIPTVPVVTLFTVGCTVDNAYLYLALILSFASYPLAMLMVYSKLPLTLDARAQVLPHIVTISEDGLSMQRFSIHTDDEGRETYIPESACDVPAHKIAAISFSKDSIVVKLKSRRIEVMIIPEKAFPEAFHHQVYAIVDKLSKRI